MSELEERTAEPKEEPMAEPGVTRTRELPVSTLLHLVGVPTVAQFQLLESKMDALTAKLTAISSKLDRVSEVVLGISEGAAVGRVELQLLEVKNIVKQLGAIRGSSLQNTVPEKPQAIEAMAEEVKAKESESNEV